MSLSGHPAPLIVMSFTQKPIMTLTSLGSKDGGMGKDESKMSQCNERIPPLRYPPPPPCCTLLTINIGDCQLVARHLNRLCQLEKSHLLVGRHMLLCLGPQWGAIWLSGKVCAREKQGGTAEGNWCQLGGPSESLPQVKMNCYFMWVK